MKGFYVNLTGVDGSGKDTIYKRVVENFPNAIQIREPGGTSEAEKIRSVILDIEDTHRITTINELLTDKNVLEITKKYLNKAKGEILEKGITGVAEVYLYAASRAQTNRTIVGPALEEGKLVLGSRSVACSMAYQAKARGLGMDFVWENNKPALNVMPDLEIFFDLPIEVALQRLRGRTDKQDRLDIETEEFHALTKLGYEEYYDNYCPYPYEKVDATQKVEDVYRQVMRILEKYNIKPGV